MRGTKSEVLKWLIDQPDKEYEVKEYHPKRSLTANSYYWSLLGELAGRLRTSREELHEIMLRRYGQYLKDDAGNIICITTEQKTDSRLLGGHYEYDGPFNGFARYKVIRGSRTYDSREFSILLDGLISECNECGVTTLTPNEILRLKGYEQTIKSNKHTN